MKKALLTARVVFAIGYTVAIAAQFAGLISFNVFSLPVLVGGLIAAALVGQVFGDYRSKPQFLVRRSLPDPSGAESSPLSAAAYAACDSTFWTRSGPRGNGQFWRLRQSVVPGTLAVLRFHSSRYPSIRSP